MTSKLTREQRINEVKELIANAEEWAGFYEHPIHDKPQREMFEGMAKVMSEHLAALAAMDSEPYGFTDGDRRGMIYEPQYADRLNNPLPVYRHAQPAPECQHQWRHGGANKLQNQKQCIKCGRVELDAQPAPVVPDTWPRKLMWSHHDDISQAEVLAWNDAIDACRAAMLQAQSVCTCPSGDGSLRWPCPSHPGNSPVIPDTWIPVSERMPERGDYLVTDGSDFDVQPFDGDQFIPGFVWEDEITHWMPLPAAPQEAK
ncbi:DUF551 domain-containing protein [Klebsiella michiganensis]|uniref:DUF551 domain-containing protein n=1 Tax=Klebsiella michiganensis TaxID=1134687 RepID=UPI002115BE1B|nr:DUF551 domain-containing protein [Klebsiella michiganensis]